MAVSAANVGDLPYRIVGAQKETTKDVTFDSSYPTNGEALTASDLGLNRVEYATAVPITGTGGGENVAFAKYDVTNSKLILYNETPAEIGNASDVSTVIVRVVARGY